MTGTQQQTSVIPIGTVTPSGATTPSHSSPNLPTPGGVTTSGNNSPASNPVPLPSPASAAGNVHSNSLNPSLLNSPILNSGANIAAPSLPTSISGAPPTAAAVVGSPRVASPASSTVPNGHPQKLQ